MSTASGDTIVPTIGMRVVVETMKAHDGADTFVLAVESWPLDIERKQAIVDAGFVNQMIEEGEARRRTIKRPEETGDVMVDLGNLEHSRPSVYVNDDAMLAMVEDYLGTFNNAVIQGVPPVIACQALCRAFALVVSSCVRANMRVGIAQALIKSVMESVVMSSDKVKVITSSNTTQ